jgi:hypothetical protein
MQFVHALLSALGRRLEHTCHGATHQCRCLQPGYQESKYDGRRMRHNRWTGLQFRGGHLPELPL